MLTLSQAIRIGSLIRPQCFGATQNKVRGGIMQLFRMVDASCAWGAAHEAGGITAVDLVATEDFIPFRGITPVNQGDLVRACVLPAQWAAASRRWEICLKCRKEDYVERLIAHLNDDHRWKRERIADWVEVIERKVAHEEQSQAVRV